MNRNFFSFFSLALGFASQAWAMDPLAVEMINVNLDRNRLPIVTMRSAQDSDECEIPTPLRNQATTVSYKGSRNSMSLSLVEEDKFVINICSASINGQAVQMPFFSVSESAKALSLSLSQRKEDGFIKVFVTTSPPNLAMINRTIYLPPEGIPFIPQGNTSSEGD